jgi:uncharacterized membrane protein YraQ (UPF0718 family)
MGKPKRSKGSMDTTTWVLVGATVMLLAVAYWRGRDLPLAGLKAAATTLWRNLAILLLGFALAGLAQVLIPRDSVSRWLGTEAGFRGVLVGCAVGGVFPGSPYAAFPMVAVLYKSGASLGAVVGFVCAWSLWSVSRLPVEIALIGAKPALVRYVLTLVVPPLAGLAAEAVTRVV